MLQFYSFNIWRSKGSKDDSEDEAELLISNIEHLDSCQIDLSSGFNSDPFKSTELMALIKSNMPPKQVIKEYKKTNRKEAN